MVFSTQGHELCMIALFYQTAIFQYCDLVRSHRAFLSCLTDRGHVGVLVHITETDVILHGYGILSEILEDNSKRMVQILQVILPNIPAVQKDLSLRGVVKPPSSSFKYRGVSRMLFGPGTFRCS